MSRHSRAVRDRDRARIRNGRRPDVPAGWSVREPAAELRAGTYGTAGRFSDRSESDPTAGLRGETCPHPAYNTLRNARMGGESIGKVRRYRVGRDRVPAELGREALTYTAR